MPPVLPDIGSRWFSTELSNPTTCIDVIRDNRYKQSRRVRIMNLPGEERHSRRPRIYPEEMGARWARQPRVPVEWMNTGSVWRVLPKTGWHDRDPNQLVSLEDLRVISTINAGGHVTMGRIMPDLTLEEVRSDFRRETVMNFIYNHCRLWASNDEFDPADPRQLFPGVLYSHEFAVRPEPPLKPKPKRKKKRQPRVERRPPTKRMKPRLTAWERLMGDE